MIIKSLLEIAFYSSLLVVKKVGSTIEENLPFIQNKNQKVESIPKKTSKESSKKEKDEDNQVSKTEKGAKLKPEEKIKIEAKKQEINLDYSDKTKKELYEIAQEIDLEGRSTMNKSQLLKALKSHSKK